MQVKEQLEMEKRRREELEQEEELARKKAEKAKLIPKAYGYPNNAARSRSKGKGRGGSAGKYRLQSGKGRRQYEE